MTRRDSPDVVSPVLLHPLAVIEDVDGRSPAYCWCGNVTSVFVGWRRWCVMTLTEQRYFSCQLRRWSTLCHACNGSVGEWYPPRWSGADKMLICSSLCAQSVFFLITLHYGNVWHQWICWGWVPMLQSHMFLFNVAFCYVKCAHLQRCNLKTLCTCTLEDAGNEFGHNPRVLRKEKKKTIYTKN